MKISVIFVLVFVASIGVPDVFGQIEQGRRQRMRMEASIKASDDQEHDRRLDTEAALPVPKAAVMNVDVQAVLAKAEYKTFAEAKLAEAKKVVDGETLWLYVKFKGKLGDYVLTTRDLDDREKLRYTLYAEIAPRGDITALSQYSIQFTKEDLPATEFKINLAPGLFGRNKSIPVFLMTSGSAKTGVWNNEFRLTNTTAFPRAMTQNLATVPITLDFSGGVSKYQKMGAEYDSIILRGSTDLTKLPIAGTFFSDALREQVAASLAKENIQPIKVYFSGDDWQEFSSFAGTPRQTKKIFATFTYRRGEGCYYGVAELVENFDFMQSRYVPELPGLKKDLAAPCTEVN